MRLVLGGWKQAGAFANSLALAFLYVFLMLAALVVFIVMSRDRTPRRPHPAPSR